MFNQGNIYKYKKTIDVMKKRVFGLFLFSLLVISFLSFNIDFVSANENINTGDRSVGEGLVEDARDFFSGGSFFSGAKDSVFFAQFLLFILVALIVYALSESLPFLKGAGSYVKGGISIIIGILSVFFLQDTEIYGILLSYGALGIVLTGVIPFILMAVFTARLTAEGYNFISRIIWSVFGIVLFFRFLAAPEGEIDGGVRILYFVLFLLVIGMLIWEKTIVGKMAKEKLDNKIDKFKNRVKAATEVEKSRAEAVYSADDDEGVTPV